jgi:[protein-PII] uridylyltransferase
MQELLAKIKASAAARLTPQLGKPPGKELARYKTFLKVETHRIKMRHRGGVGGRLVCQARAFLVDTLLKHLWETGRASISEQGQQGFSKIALVALGGYGRAELNPHSDVDLMFLHQGQVAAGKPLPYLARAVDAVLYPLWDLGFKVGPSTRTLDEAVKMANSDMQSKTAMIEARLVAGDEGIFKKLQQAIVAKCVQGHEQEYIAARVQDQAARHAKFGNSASMQEPNIKNGCGGLRDYQNLLWMAYFKYRKRSPKDLLDCGLISTSERKQLEEAYDFLLRVRTEMHYLQSRGLDVLGKNLQPTVAHNLGYVQRSPSQRIERFMRDLYSHSRNIFLLTRTLEQRLALQPESKLFALTSWLPGRRKRQSEPLDGFVFTNGEILASSNKVFREQPRRLMRVFLYAQQRGLRLHPDLAQLVRRQLYLVNRSFLSDEHARDTFVAILNQRGTVAPVLRAMHEVDFLGKYLPEFGQLTCLVQHEFYHQYTADEHTLVCLEQLDRVWEAKDPMRARYAELLRGLERPFLLYLALLLHDVGKAKKGHERGRHDTVGAQLALRAARRLRLDSAAIETLNRVVEHHLLLVDISQRCDLEDPGVIRHVAKLARNPETLALLTLHTFVDTLATSDKLWNGFKDSLLWTLHNKASRLMTGGPEFYRAEEMRREVFRDEVQRLVRDSITEEELDAHFGTLPPRYFLVNTAKQVVDDLLLAQRFFKLQLVDEAESALAPVLGWHDDPDRGMTTVRVCTWDRAGLFSKIAGSLSAAGLNILSAQIFTRNDGIALDTFSVTDLRTAGVAATEQREKFYEVLHRALTKGDVDFPALIGRQKPHGHVFQAYTGERMPTQVRFDNESAEHRTRLEIETEDRLGLLYAISKTLGELNLDIVGAKIFTEKGAAIDNFFIRESDGKQVLTVERHQTIELKVRTAIAGLYKPTV